MKNQNKKYVSKKVVSLLTGIFVIMSGTVCTIPFGKFLSANNTTIDDGPAGEKIIDITAGKLHESFYAVTEGGNVYAWGNNSYGQLGLGTGTSANYSVPQKVLNSDTANDNEQYLSHVVKVYGGGYGSSTASYSAASVFALTSNNELYAWGDNKNGSLGLPEYRVYSKPTKVSLPAGKVIKDVIPGYRISSVLFDDGSVYVTGTNSWGLLGLGISDLTKNINTFTQITLDNEGNPLPPIKQVVNSYYYSLLLGTNGKIYGTGDYSYNGTKCNGCLRPAAGKVESADDTNQLEDITNVMRIIGVPFDGAGLIQLEDGNVYLTYSVDGKGKSRTYYHPVSDISTFVDPMNLISNADFWYGYMVYSEGFVTNDHKIYTVPGSASAGWNGKTVIKEYIAGDIKSGYNNAKKIIGDLLLSIDGGVYYQGIKISFGSVSVKGEKSDNTVYKSKEKFNDSVTLQASINSGVTFTVSVK